MLHTGLLLLVLAFLGGESFSSFSYVRAHLLGKVAAILGMVALVFVAQNLARAAVATQNSVRSENLDCFTEGVAGLALSFIVAVAAP